MAISIEEVPCESNGSAFALPLVASFLRDYWRRLVAISALVIVPCLWQPRIEAGDLPSHVYNAWLGHLITTGRLPASGSRSDGTMFFSILRSAGWERS